MPYVTFAFNCGLYRTFIDAGRESVYIDEGYLPLLRAFRKHPRIKANFFIEGLTALALKNNEEFRSLLIEGIDDGQFEMGTYTYNHPVLTLLPFEDCQRQWKLGREIDEEVWGVRPLGAAIPEAAWDSSNVQILTSLGIEWVMLGSRVYYQDFPDHPPHTARRSFRLRGTGGTGINAVCHDCDHFGEDEPAFYICGSVVQGAGENIQAFRDRVAFHRAQEADGVLMAVKNDGEFVYEEALSLKYGRGWHRTGFSAHLGESIPELVAGAEANLEKALAGYEETSDVEFVTLSEYFRKVPPDREVLLRSSAKGYREWSEGSEKMEEILKEAQIEIRVARGALNVAGALGARTKEAEQELERAWMLLLEAETSTGRRACAHPAGKASRILRAMENALEAARTARASLHLIIR